MEPALPYQSVQVVNKINAKSRAKLSLQQIVVYKSTEMNYSFIGRIIAQENDTIRIQSEPGKFTVSVNGQVLNEPYTDASKNNFTYDSGEITIDRGHYLVMSDARETLPPP